jgi:acetyl-CoA synthetase (ADP-forming)
LLQIFRDADLPVKKEAADGEKIPEFTNPRRAARVIRHMVWYRQYLESGIPEAHHNVSERLDLALRGVEAKDLLKKAGVPVVETRLATTRQQAAIFARSMAPRGPQNRFPRYQPQERCRRCQAGAGQSIPGQKSFREMLQSVHLKIPAARLQGVAVQKMAPPGIELIIGMSRDPQFGPVIMFGLGGIFVEIFKDVSFRLVPLSRRDASEMVREIKGLPLLQGYRGRGPVDLAVVEDLILQISDYVQNNPQVKEIDLNPVLAYQHSLLAVDARIVMEKEAASF